MTPRQPESQTPSSSVFQPAEIRAVEASAGSGKTFALARRYVQLLFLLNQDPVPSKSILAITFSRKAALEMKTRILRFLKQCALGAMQEWERQAILDPMRVDEQKAAALGSRILPTLLQHYNFFQVQTIDKFLNAILSGCAFRIGLTPRFQIRTQASETLAYALDYLLDRAVIDPDQRQVFDDFLIHYLVLENRQGWSPRKDILKIMENLYGLYNSYGKSFVTPTFSHQDVLKGKASFLTLIRSLVQDLPPGLHGTDKKQIETFSSQAEPGFDFDAVPTVFKKECPRFKKGEKIPRGFLNQWRGIRRHLARIVWMEAQTIFAPYGRLFRQVQQTMEEEKRREDIIFLSELGVKARSLFSEEGLSVEELYWRLAARFRHYLIDEFQDTSRLQWENIAPLVEEGLANGGTLFYVGDRKQAIYGFRGGDPRLFDEIPLSLPAAYPRCPEILSVNYRSCPEIVRFNNDLFSERSLNNLFCLIRQRQEDDSVLRDEDKKMISKIFERTQQRVDEKKFGKEEGGYVRIEKVEGRLKEDRNEDIKEKLIHLVRDRARVFSWRDMAILVRTHEEAKAVAGWLLESDIPVNSERTSDVQKNHLIESWVDCLRFLDSPIDNASFARFLLSPLFEAASGLSRKGLQDFVFHWASHSQREISPYLYTSFRAGFPDVWDRIIDPLFKTVGLKPVYELLIQGFEITQCLSHFADDQAFFMHFLDLAKGYEEEGYDVEGFLHFYENLEKDKKFVNIASADAVKVMTQHASKGLDFRVVILPFLSLAVSPLESPEGGQPSFLPVSDTEGLRLLRIKKSMRLLCPELAEYYREAYRDELISALNTVYVSLTRAQEEMFAFVPSKSGRDTNWIFSWFNDDLIERGRPRQNPCGHRDTGDSVVIQPSISEQGYHRAEFAALSRQSARRHRQQREGEIRHALLAAVGNAAISNWESSLERRAWSLQESFGLTDQERDDLIEEIGRLVEAEALRDVFFAGDQEVFTEKEIVTPQGQTKRVDRLMISDREAIVVDYKSHADDPDDFSAQMKEYAACIKALYPTKTVKTWIVDLARVEKKEVYVEGL